MDWTLFKGINDLANRTGWAHGLMRDNAKYGVVVFALLLIIAGLTGLRGRAQTLARAIWTAGAAMIALGLNQPIANAVDRARPYASHANVHLLVSRTTDPSFMSDHSIIAGAVAVGLFFVSRRLGIIATVFGILMAFTRVYVGAHYPGDVVAGFAFAGLFTAAGMPLADKFLTPMLEHLLSTTLGRRLIKIS